MNPIEFEVTRTKVKVTMALNTKNISTNIYRTLWPTVVTFGVEIDGDYQKAPIDF